MNKSRGARILALAGLLALLLGMGAQAAEVLDARYDLPELGLTILAPGDWVVEDAQSIERINVMQIDDKLTHPKLLLSMAKQEERGFQRLEISREGESIYTNVHVYAAALLVDMDRMLSQLGEEPKYRPLVWPELEWPGFQVTTEKFQRSCWVIEQEGAFYVLQTAHSLDWEGAEEEILALIEMNP